MDTDNRRWLVSLHCQATGVSITTVVDAADREAAAGAFVRKMNESLLSCPENVSENWTTVIIPAPRAIIAAAERGNIAIPFGPPDPTDRQKCGTAIEIPKDLFAPGDVVADDDETEAEEKPDAPDSL